jgi:hypothetical protein
MRPIRDVETIVRDLRRPVEAETHDRILSHLLELLNQRQKQSAGTAPALRRVVMKNPITRLAAAAVFLVGLCLFIGLLMHTTTPAYALDQTVEANQSLRFIHIKDFAPDHEDEPKEFWIACDAQGGIESVRYEMPAWDAPEDGARSVVWSQGVAQVWSHKKNALVIYRNDTVAQRMAALAQACDPRHAVERLSEAEKQGKLKLEIEQPADKSKPIVVTATYLTGDSASGRRDILYVDQATKLVVLTQFERMGSDGQYAAQGRQEYYDYNVPIAAGMFTLDEEVPADVTRADQVTRDVGLAQGTLSDEEAAAETVRQFFEALKAQDYDKAGVLMGGVPAAKMQEWYGSMKVVQIISIGEPQPHSDPGVGGFIVPCEVLLQDQAGKTYSRPFPRVAVRPVNREKQPHRWNIHGGI